MYNLEEIKKNLNISSIIITGDENRVEYNYVPKLLVYKVKDKLKDVLTSSVKQINFINSVKAVITLNKNISKIKIKLSKKELYYMYFDSKDKEEELEKYLSRYKIKKNIIKKVLQLEEELNEIKSYMFDTDDNYLYE